MNSGYINEIFASYQGEGKYIGARQLFIRLSGCSINCKDCDTDNEAKDYFLINDTKVENPVTAEALAALICCNYDLKMYHSISITGGEPLEQLEFVKAFVKMMRQNSVLLFLETSGFYPEKLLNIEDLFDILSIDIKLSSVFGVGFNKKIFDALKMISKEKYYLKIIVSEDINWIELSDVINSLQMINETSVYVQPHNDLVSEALLNKLFTVFSEKDITAFYVPQVHKLIRIR